MDIGQYFDLDEARNELSPEEEKKFIAWEVVVAKQKQLEKQFNTIQNKNSKIAYELNNDLLLLSLYSLIPPLRNEVKHLKFTDTRKEDYDYIFFSHQNIVVLDLNLEKKRHDPIEFNLSKESPKLVVTHQP